MCVWESMYVRERERVSEGVRERCVCVYKREGVGMCMCV